MRNIFIFSVFQLKLLFRDFKLTLVGFLMPVLMFAIFSTVMSEFSFETGNINIVEYLIPAFIPIITINAILLIYGQYFIMYREQGTLLKYKLLGLSDTHLRLSIFIPSFIFQILAIVILILTGYFLQDLSFPFENLHNIVLTIILINVLQYSITSFLISVISNSSSYQSISVLLFNYQMFLGGLTFPPELFPEGLKFVLEYLNPVYYGLIILRGVWTDGESFFDFTSEVMILIAVSLALFLLSIIIGKRKHI